MSAASLTPVRTARVVGLLLLLAFFAAVAASCEFIFAIHDPLPGDASTNPDASDV